MFVDEIGGRLTKISLVDEQAATSVAAGAASPLKPFAPFRVVHPVRLLVLRLEHTDPLLYIDGY